jgi:AcrR family transcriptional regulator
VTTTDIRSPESEPTGECRPLRADARRNRERILSAAREAFAESGAEAQIDDVAHRAGVGVGTVYRHFPTKEQLLAELVRQKFALFAGNAREALASAGEPFEILAALLRRNAELCARDAAIQHALAGMGEIAWSQAGTELGELLELTSELVARAQRAGQMRLEVTGADIPMLMCGVSATMGSTAPDFDWRRHLELVISMLRA